MLSKVFSGVTVGLDGVLIEVEVDVANRGFPSFTIVGLPNKSIDEAKDRVRTAVVNSSYEMPDSRITVNLAPASIPKEGSQFDLPIAVGILASSGMVEKASLKESIFLGELSLEGQVKRVNGVISIVLAAKKSGIKRVFLSYDNTQEASLINNIEVLPVLTLLDVVLHLNGQKAISPFPKQHVARDIKEEFEFDFKEVRGQEYAKRALEIAAAGFHNVHLTGPPGAGKTMLSRAFPSICPSLGDEEILEVTKIYSVAGLCNGSSLMMSRPFRSPHHTISKAGLIGGSGTPRPGEISLAHRGILFLDEFSEFPRSVLESLRQPLEDGKVSISRAAGAVTFPSRFVLLAASNPCPCGYLGHPNKKCRCMPGVIDRYKKRLSGPLIDRIDLHVDVHPVEKDKLIEEEMKESSKEIRKRVTSAHMRQKKRYAKSRISCNTELRPQDVKRLCNLTSEARDILAAAVSKLSLSARSYFKMIKISQTIADIEGEQNIQERHVAEALQYRAKET